MMPKNMTQPNLTLYYFLFLHHKHNNTDLFSPHIAVLSPLIPGYLSTTQHIKHTTSIVNMRTLWLLVLAVFFTMCVTQTSHTPVRNIQPRHLSLTIRAKHNKDANTQQKSNKTGYNKKKRKPPIFTKKHKIPSGLEYQKKQRTLAHSKRHNFKSQLQKNTHEHVEIPYIDDVYGPETEPGIYSYDNSTRHKQDKKTPTQTTPITPTPTIFHYKHFLLTGTRQLPPERILSFQHSLPFQLIKNSRKFGLGLDHGNHLHTVKFGPFGFYNNFHHS